MRTKAWLTIRQRGKAIPYPASLDEKDEHRNHGFKPLKGRPDEAAVIPEVLDDPPLRDALIAINDAETGFFTVGPSKP